MGATAWCCPARRVPTPPSPPPAGGVGPPGGSSPGPTPPVERGGRHDAERAESGRPLRPARRSLVCCRRALLDVERDKREEGQATEPRLSVLSLRQEVNDGPARITRELGPRAAK